MYDTYVVEKNDTIGSISSKFNTSPEIIYQLNGYVVVQNRFPDGTLALNEINGDLLSDNFANWIDWMYDGDEEMFTIMSLVDIIRRNSQGRIYLKMPYLPNARMDRIKTDTENFALKVFAKIF